MSMNGFSYESRSACLLYLGFKSYGEYLGSPMWKHARFRAFHFNGKKCVLCRALATEIHHECYAVEDLKGDRTKYMHPICRGCHEAVERTKNGTKRSMEEAHLAFLAIRSTNALPPKVAKVHNAPKPPKTADDLLVEELKQFLRTFISGPPPTEACAQRLLQRLS